ncbi:MAG: dTMP kinase [bacterium]|nr:dTMP kinase [bacterium]
MFIIADGIDGSGKGTVVQALVERRRKRGDRVFDLREFTRTEHRLPEPEELTPYNVLVSGEPTYTWVGAALRDELVRANERTYSARRTAEAFALDRLILYRRVLLPARARGMDIYQERGVTSSLVYQLQQPAIDGTDRDEDSITIDALCALEGNRLALANPPDALLLLTVDPSRALRRLELRIDKQDESVFERLAALERLHAEFQSDRFRRQLAQHGWRIEYVDANGAVEDAVAAAALRVDAATVTTHTTL